MRLAGRALDDLHTLAKASGDAVEREQRWKQTVDALRQDVSDLHAATGENSGRQGDLAERLDALDGHLVTMLDKIEAVEEVLPSRAEAVAEVERIRTDVSTLAAAAEPMGEAAGRVERLASRLPGGGP